MTIRIPGTGSVSVPANGRMKVSPSFTPITATGGNITDVTVDNVTYRVHTFTGIGTFEVTSAVNNTATVEYLVVAGGGGGGGGRGFPSDRPYTYLGGGGGAGGFLTGTLNLNVGSYNIDIGGGGTGGQPNGPYPSPTNPGLNGDPSKITFPSGTTIIESIGGGGGGGTGPGISGGSGGGGGGQAGGAVGTIGQGRGGGSGAPGPSAPWRVWSGGGGGGAGSPGSPGAPPYPGNRAGGNGLESFITGYPQFYAGGGGGGPSGTGGSAVGGAGGGPLGADGIAYTGSGGGGGGTNSSTGGNGASGIVIIRYRIS